MLLKRLTGIKKKFRYKVTLGRLEVTPSQQSNSFQAVVRRGRYFYPAL
jgi:hypothetical protein